MHVVLCLLLSLGAAALGGPAPQNYFPASQYIASAPGYPALQFNPVKQQPYLQQLASQYVPAPQQAPVYEGAPQTYLQQYTQQQQQPQPIQQVLLPSAVDRQASISRTCGGVVHQIVIFCNADCVGNVVTNGNVMKVANEHFVLREH